MPPVLFTFLRYVGVGAVAGCLVGTRLVVHKLSDCDAARAERVNALAGYSANIDALEARAAALLAATSSSSGRRQDAQ